MILDGSGVRKNTLEVVIPPQPVVKFNPKFEQKIIELHAKVENLPDLEPQFVDENSSDREKKVERKAVETSQKDPATKKVQPPSNQKRNPKS